MPPRPSRTGTCVDNGGSLDLSSLTVDRRQAHIHRRSLGGQAAVTQERHADVIIVGGGPAGSVLAWDLARRGVQVLLLERARFPREKVCGDYVEPRGLRILQAMGCLEHLEPSKLLPISRTATFVEWECHYSGPIPSYGLREGLPAHGYLIPRERLDAAMLDTAMRAGAIVHEETAVTGVSAGPAGALNTSRTGSSLPPMPSG